MRILFFGDSITQGFWDTAGGWVDRIRKDYDRRQIEDLEGHDEPTVFNLGVSANKSVDVLKRMRNEIEARRYPGEKFTLVFSVGVNDTYEKEGKTNTSLEEFTGNIKAIIKLAREFSTKILFVGLTGVDEARTCPVFWDTNFWTNAKISSFDKVLEQVVAAEGISFVPVFELFKDKPELLADGLHPNDKGHELIANTVKPQLEVLLSKQDQQ